LSLVAGCGERVSDRRLLALVADGNDARWRESGVEGAPIAPPSGGSFMTHLRQRLKRRRRSKKPLAFEDDSHK
jgi:hypothetical protein